MVETGAVEVTKAFLFALFETSHILVRVEANLLVDSPSNNNKNE